MLGAQSRLSLNRLRSYRAKVEIFLESSDYILYTNGTFSDIQEALELRHQTFYQEKKLIRKNLNIDIDSFDKTCDFLFIRNKKNNKHSINNFHLLLFSKFNINES